MIMFNEIIFMLLKSYCSHDFQTSTEIFEILYFVENAAEAFATKCQKCTETQKKNLEKIVVWYTENRPDEWNAMIQKLLQDAKKMNITPVL